MFGNLQGNNAFDARIEYQNAIAALKSAGSGLPNWAIDEAKCTQSFLRLEQQLVTNQTNFTFPIMINQGGGPSGNVRVTERRLKLQDAFFVAGWSMYLTKSAALADTNMKLCSYPNPVTFTADGATIYNLWNGVLTLTVNGVVIIPAYPTSNFLVVPATQLTAATNSPIDEIDLSNRQALQPNPVLIGSNNNELNLVIPNAIAAVGFDIITFILHGILAQNVTVMVNGQ